MGKRPVLVFALLFWGVLAAAASESQMKCKIENGHLSGSALTLTYDLKEPAKVRLERSDLGKLVDSHLCRLVEDSTAALAFDCEFNENGRDVEARYRIRKGQAKSACSTSVETTTGKFKLPDQILSCS